MRVEFPDSVICLILFKNSHNLGFFKLGFALIAYLPRLILCPREALTLSLLTTITRGVCAVTVELCGACIGLIQSTQIQLYVLHGEGGVQEEERG